MSYCSYQTLWTHRLHVCTNHKLKNGLIIFFNYFIKLQVDQRQEKLDIQRRRWPSYMRKSNRCQTLPSQLYLSVCRSKPQPRLHQLRQLPLVDAHHLPAHHARLLGERLQHGKKTVSISVRISTGARYFPSNRRA